MLKPSDFPSFEGELSFSESSRREVSSDFGHVYHNKPLAVLTPSSVDDVCRLLCFANTVYGLKVVTRGQGHSAGGQSLTGGVVINSRGLRKIRSLEKESVWVEAGLTWLELAEKTLAQGSIPPGLNDFLELSIGGALSVGGVGGQAFRFGTQVDNVLALEVVTGAGEKVVCSREESSDLFDAVLAGLGQCAVITAAKLRLVPAYTRARTYEALYFDAESFLNLQMELCHQGQFDYVAGLLIPSPAGGWGFLVQVSKFYHPTQEPDDQSLMKVFGDAPTAITDRELLSFLDRKAEQAKELQANNLWEVPHPWLTQFFPRGEARGFVERLASRVSPDEIQGVIATYPLFRSKSVAPLLCLPASEEIFLVGVLSSAVPNTEEKRDSLVSLARSLYEDGTRHQSKVYPIGLLPRGDEWALQYGERWLQLNEWKGRFDPMGVLGFSLR
jgi:cytokinin dehydrogenase